MLVSLFHPSYQNHFPHLCPQVSLRYVPAATYLRSLERQQRRHCHGRLFLLQLHLFSIRTALPAGSLFISGLCFNHCWPTFSLIIHLCKMSWVYHWETRKEHNDTLCFLCMNSDTGTQWLLTDFGEREITSHQSCCGSVWTGESALEYVLYIISYSKYTIVTETGVS